MARKFKYFIDFKHNSVKIQIFEQASILTKSNFRTKIGLLLQCGPLKSKVQFLPTVDWCEIQMVSADIFHSFLACFPWWSCIHEKPTLLMLIFSRWMLSCQKGRRVQKSLMFTSIHLALNKKPRSALLTFLPLSF